MRTIANVLAPTSIDVEKGTNANAHTAAVVICHGMGQQVKWQTLGQLVNSLERAGKLDPTFAPRVRQVQFTDDKGPFYQGRAELLVCDAETDAARHVHVYEAYWAPLTEGRISLSQTVVFLITAGLSGIRHAFGPLRRYGRFSTTDRAATSKVHEFPPDRGVLFSFLVALLVLLALLVMNTAITVTQLKALASATERPQDRTLLALLTGDLWAFELGALVYLAAIGLAHLYRSRRCRARHAFHVPQLVQVGLWTVTLALVTLTIGIGLWAIPGHYLVHASGRHQQTGFEYWLLRAPADAAQAAIGAALASMNGAFARLDPLEVHAVLVWGLVIAMSYWIRGVLVQYVGDVAIYVSHHMVSTFDETRDAIKALTRRVLCAVCEQGGYERVVLVGHSLGSVVAYDALNGTMLAEDVAIATGASKYHVERIPRLITFGSPLDKTAFIFRSKGEADAPIREGLAAAVQPLLVHPPSRDFQWTNLHSSNDIISGRLDFYPGVVNEPDPQADIPIWAHTQFWSNQLLADQLTDACLRPFDPIPADRAYETGIDAAV
jgi:hypothetical protein